MPMTVGQLFSIYEFLRAEREITATTSD